MNQPSLFDQAKDARDQAIDQVARNNPSDKLKFELAARAYIKLSKPFTTDDVLATFPGLEAIREKRVFGAVMLKLAKEGLVRAGGYRHSNRKKSHARPKRVWIPN